jgi:hypothetical protein
VTINQNVFTVGEYDYLQMSPKHAPLPKPRVGTMAYADGADWNPGNAGQGLYCYDGSNWKLLDNVTVFNSIVMATQTAEPTPQEGMIAFANGTTWNPGATGKGLYCYHTSAWHKII